MNPVNDFDRIRFKFSGSDQGMLHHESATIETYTSVLGEETGFEHKARE
jgi:hypothetical protein